MVGSAAKTQGPPKLDIAALDAAYRVIDGQLGLCSRQTEKNARHMMSVVDRILDETSSEAAPPGVAALLAFLMEWISEYEAANVKMPESTPAELLRHLMQVNQLRQSHLAAELGGQSVVSEILSGKRKINLRQAQALALRFNVSPAAFVERAPSQSPVLVTADSSKPTTLLEVFLARGSNNQFSPEVLAAFEAVTASSTTSKTFQFEAVAHDS